MNPNLRPITSTEQARILGKKGGSVSSKRKSEAAKLREIRKRIDSGKTTKKDEEWLLSRIEDPYFMAFDILLLIEQIGEEAETFQEKISLIKLKMKFFEIWHKKKKVVICPPESEWEVIINT